MSFITSGKQKLEDKKNKKKDDSMTVAKPLTQSEDFVAELMDGSIDFSSIEDKQFLVAVNTGNRNKPLLLASTMRGPFGFYEMVESVGCMWEREQHHAKVYVLTKSFDESSQFLDEGTVDYIEANWDSMITTGIFETAVWDDDDVTIPAGLINACAEDDE